MPKKVPEQEFREIEEFIRRFPGGVDAVAIRNAADVDLTDRTLQRRLNQLVDQGRIEKQGRKRGTRYFPVKKQDHPAWEAAKAEVPDYLSEEGREIAGLVGRPMPERQPVGYRMDLLRDYMPNVSAYLSPERREALEKMGRVGTEDLPAGTYLRQIMDRLLIDLSWNSSRLEGNTYSLLDTQRLLVQGEMVEGKDAEETQMILNHKAAIEMLADDAEEIGFNRYTLCNLHALLSENLLPDSGAGGRLRSRPVGISASVFEPLQVPQQIEENFDLMLSKAEAILNPYEQSLFIMVHLPYLQPFDDVNKRVSRLAAHIPLVRRNLCPLSFVDVDREIYIQAVLGVYELGRTELMRDVFLWAYRRSCARYTAIRQSLGEPDPFRLKYREQIGQFVREVVTSRMNKAEASVWIAEQTERELQKKDQQDFRNRVEEELDGLHIGNIARYRLRPAEFEVWKSTWGT